MCAEMSHPKPGPTQGTLPPVASQPSTLPVPLIHQSKAARRCEATGNSLRGRDTPLSHSSTMLSLRCFAAWHLNATTLEYLVPAKGQHSDITRGCRSACSAWIHAVKCSPSTLSEYGHGCCQPSRHCHQPAPCTLAGQGMPNAAADKAAATMLGKTSNSRYSTCLPAGKRCCQSPTDSVQLLMARCCRLLLNC